MYPLNRQGAFGIELVEEKQAGKCLFEKQRRLSPLGRFQDQTKPANIICSSITSHRIGQPLLPTPVAMEIRYVMLYLQDFLTSLH
jgi:hypothetical protein